MLHANQNQVKKIDITIPKDQIRRKKPFISIILILILIIGSGILAKFNIDLNFKVSDLENQETEIIIENGATIEFAENQEIKTEIETDEGEIEVLSLPVVDVVDGGQMQVEENELDFGRGEYYPFETPNIFADATLGKCIDLDGKWGAQCVDLFAVFHYEYANRWLDTCGTGTARGLWQCKDKNAGNEYKLIYNIEDLQSGDWIIFDGGQYGHVGMALGSENNNYISLLGQNQGGTSCSGGGSATNIINISLKTFLGAFRPKIYDAPKAPDTGIPPSMK